MSFIYFIFPDFAKIVSDESKSNFKGDFQMALVKKYGLVIGLAVVGVIVYKKFVQKFLPASVQL